MSLEKLNFLKKRRAIAQDEAVRLIPAMDEGHQEACELARKNVTTYLNEIETLTKQLKSTTAPVAQFKKEVQNEKENEKETSKEVGK